MGQELMVERIFETALVSAGDGRAQSREKDYIVRLFPQYVFRAGLYEPCHVLSIGGRQAIMYRYYLIMCMG